MSGKTFKIAERIIAKDAIKLQEEIINNIHTVYPDLEIIHIGSVGKKNDDDTHGDIDLAIKTDTYESLCSIVKSVYPDVESFEHKGKSLYVYSINLPYISIIDNLKHYVQCDFMLVHDIDYAKFRYYCPDYRINESKYKVYTRIILWKIIINECLRYNNVPDGYFAAYYIYPTGIYRDVINEDNIFQHEKSFYTDSVNDIINIAFKDTDIKDALTIENMWMLLHSDKFKYPEKLKQIELLFFTQTYSEISEDLHVYPEDFELSCWTPNEIHEACKKYDKQNALNRYLYKMQKR